MARQIEDEFGHLRQLILIGKERGYLLYDEINESLPADANSSQEIDDLLSILERQGIEIYEDTFTGFDSPPVARRRGGRPRGRPFTRKANVQKSSAERIAELLRSGN